jgi:hypothetical protein
MHPMFVREILAAYLPVSFQIWRVHLPKTYALT